jgi:hypothetical protein
MPKPHSEVFVLASFLLKIEAQDTILVNEVET